MLRTVATTILNESSLQRVNKALKEAVRTHLASTLTANAFLSVYFPKPRAFRTVMRNTGTIIGAIVVGAALLLVIGGFLLAWRQRNSRRKAEYMAADTRGELSVLPCALAA